MQTGLETPPPPLCSCNIFFNISLIFEKLSFYVLKLVWESVLILPCFLDHIPVDKRQFNSSKYF